MQAISNDQAPPDSMGAAGPTYLVEIVNGQAAYINKTTKARTELSLNAFFGNPSVVVIDINGNLTTTYLKAYDPRIVYDEGSSRFFAIAAAMTSSDLSHLLIAVSNGSDPTAGWEHRKIYAGVPESGGIVGTWLEYPTLGVNKDAIYVAGSMVDDDKIDPQSPPGQPQAKLKYVFSKLWRIPKDHFTSTSSPPPAFSWKETKLTIPIAGEPEPPEPIYQPCLTFGTGDQYMVSALNGGDTQIKVSKITLATNGEISVNNTGTATGISFTRPGANQNPQYRLPQKGTSEKLHTIGARLMNAVFRSGSIWTTHMVDAGDGLRSIVKWYKINPTATGATPPTYTITDPNRSYFYPSIAVNSAGDVALGFSGTSSTEYAGAYYVVRDHADLGSSSAPILGQAGLAPYVFSNYEPYKVRWGDYSMTCADPAGTFWTFQEYAPSQPSSSHRWATYINGFTSADSLLPSATITLPEANKAYLAPLTATGTARAPAGATVSSVSVALWYDDGSGPVYFKGGTTWSATYVASVDQPATYNPTTGNWSYDLPASDQSGATPSGLIPHRYFLRPRVTDSVQRTFYFDPQRQFYIVQAVDAATSNAATDSPSRILATTTDGFWTVSEPIIEGEPHEIGGFGTVYSAAGWKASRISIGGGGNARVLLNNSSSGKATVWSMTGTEYASSLAAFGPISSWSCKDVTVDGSGNAYLLWVKGDRNFAIWKNDQFHSTNAMLASNDLEASALSVNNATTGNSNIVHILLGKPDGTAAFWAVPPDSYPGSNPGNLGNTTRTYTAGPYRTTDITTGSDNFPRPMWTNNDRFALWKVDVSNGTYQSEPPVAHTLGSGWRTQSVASGGDAKQRALCVNEDGRASIWVLPAAAANGPPTSGAAPSVAATPDAATPGEAAPDETPVEATEPGAISSADAPNDPNGTSGEIAPSGDVITSPSPFGDVPTSPPPTGESG